MRRIPILAATALTALTLALGGCTAEPAPTATADGAFTGELRVAAAASLQGAFDEAIEVFTEKHPGVKVVPTYDGSSTLATQIENGANVDVFASADMANMTRVESLVEAPVEFARNSLVVIVSQGSSDMITTLDDLALPEASIVLCAPQVPCGAASQTLLQQQGVVFTPASLEQNVTAVLTKVAADEADAGLVYKTDAAASADVVSFVPEGADQVVNTYPIAELRGSRNPDVSYAFVRFITGPEGQKILSSYGFDSP